ncbi:MAG: hypothetical protein EA396_04555 [Anaerolineaceae bacterium]|nr:MAG: hypothetical protein EA396_04555 [Anaerolineaceae bacterium]
MGVRWGLLLACAWLLVACASAPDAVRTPFPTLTLIALPPTATSAPPTATPTSAVLISPADLITPTPAGSSQALVEMARADVGGRDDLARADIRLAHVAPRRWASAETLDCQPAETDDPRAMIDGYEIILTGGGQVYIYHSDRTRVQLCAAMPLDQVPGDVLVRFDAIAADFLRVARRDLARRLDVDTSRIALHEMGVVVWPDTSLGCPRPNQTYTETRTTGYRILLTVDGVEYAYHTDYDRVLLCPSAN